MYLREKLASVIPSRCLRSHRNSGLMTRGCRATAEPLYSATVPTQASNQTLSRLPLLSPAPPNFAPASVYNASPGPASSISKWYERQYSDGVHRHAARLFIHGVVASFQRGASSYPRETMLRTTHEVTTPGDHSLQHIQCFTRRSPLIASFPDHPRIFFRRRDSFLRSRRQLRAHIAWGLRSLVAVSFYNGGQSRVELLREKFHSDASRL